jgi:hypothetical protein
MTYTTRTLATTNDRSVASEPAGFFGGHVSCVGGVACEQNQHAGGQALQGGRNPGNAGRCLPRACYLVHTCIGDSGWDLFNHLFLSGVSARDWSESKSEDYRIEIDAVKVLQIICMGML